MIAQMLRKPIMALGGTVGTKIVASGRDIPRRRELQRFLDDSFLIQVLRQLKIDCVLDVGANRGQYALGLRKMGYTGEIHSFEPIPRDFDIMKKRAAGDRDWHVYNFALGREEGTQAFNVIGDDENGSDFSSFLAPDDEIVPRGITRIPVEVRTLDAIAGDIEALTDPSRRVYLKLDTQGFDIEVCEGARSIIPNLAGLQSEISVRAIYEGQVDYLTALKYYRDLGFAIMDMAVVTRAKSGAVVEYDCVMGRESLV